MCRLVWDIAPCGAKFTRPTTIHLKPHHQFFIAASLSNYCYYYYYYSVMHPCKLHAIPLFNVSRCTVMMCLAQLLWHSHCAAKVNADKAAEVGAFNACSSAILVVRRNAGSMVGR